MGSTSSVLSITDITSQQILAFASTLDTSYVEKLKGLTGQDLDKLTTKEEITKSLNDHGVTNDDDVKKLTMKLIMMRLPPFPKHGVSLALLQKMKAMAVENDWTTTDLSENFIKPETKPMQCSFEEFMRVKHSDTPHPAFGLIYSECFMEEATVFVSHAWKYKFGELITAVETFTTEQAKAKPWSYWVDAFVNDQWNAPNLPYEWWSGTFSSAIGEIGHTMLVLSPWDAPIPLTRAWCLWEILCTIKNKAELTVQLSVNERASFVSTLRTDYSHIMKSFSKIDVANSEAWNPNDKGMIFAAVEAEEGGFGAVNNTICAQMRDWLARTARSLAVEGDVGKAWTVNELDDLTRAADLLSDQGKLDEALEMYLKALDGYIKVVGADDEHTLNTTNNLAVLYSGQGRFQEAETMFRKALDSKVKTLGFANEDTLDTATNLGNVLMELGRLDEARAMFNKAINGFHSISSKGDQVEGERSASLLNNLGNLNMREEKNDEAKTCYERALAIQVTCFIHILSMQCVYSPCFLFCSFNQYEKQEASLGPDHPDTLSTVNNLANVYNSTGKIPEAQAMYERAFKVR